MPIFMVLGGHAEQRFDAAEDLAGEGDLVRTVHLRLDDIHRAFTRVLAASSRAYVIERDRAGDDGIHDALGHFAAIAVKNGRIGHEVTNIAHQYQRTAMQLEDRTVRRRDIGIGVELADEGTAAVGNPLLKVALHQAEPVTIDDDLVFGIDGRDGILAVHNRRDCRFQPDIRNMRGIGLPDRRFSIDDDLDMDAVVLEENMSRHGGTAPVAGEVSGILEGMGFAICIGNRQFAAFDLQGSNVLPGAAVQRHGVIKKIVHPGDNLLAALGIVAPALLRTVGLRNGIRTVERVVERAPAGIGGVQRIAGIHHGYDELRAGDRGDLGIDIAGRHLEIGAFGKRVADLTQEALIGLEISQRTVLAVPAFDFRLHFVALGKERPVLRP